MTDSLASAIYSGKLRHRRFSPKTHEFEYSVFMLYLDTKEIDAVFSLNRFWSIKHFAPVQFKRSDFHEYTPSINFSSRADEMTSVEMSVDEAVRRTIAQHTGDRPNGPIRMLVNLRYWGFNMNPLSTYYCFDETGQNLEYILAEVHNTPWGERHAYVLPANSRVENQLTKHTDNFQFNFKKSFHVSPFNPLNMEYRWRSSLPNKNLVIHLENWLSSENSAPKIMDATLVLEREELTKKSMQAIIWRFPLMTLQVLAAIYWQALKLWFKRIPIYQHTKPTEVQPQESDPLRRSINKASNELVYTGDQLSINLSTTHPNSTINRNKRI